MLEQENIVKCFERAKKGNGRLHFMGLVRFHPRFFFTSSLASSRPFNPPLVESPDYLASGLYGLVGTTTDSLTLSYQIY